MLTNINIQGFKSLGSTSLVLSPLTILTGMEEVIRFLADFPVIRNKKITQNLLL